ncbi:MAG: aminopeptidase P family protein [Bacteroidales bacterium]|nr:aminopeptidase P family protein [Bacteroidales bacterium]
MNVMLDTLRKELKIRNITAYIVFNTDPHGSEYIPKDFMFIKALTGFTGDNATVIVTQSFAGLWTDSRFFLSGEKELKNSGFTLMNKEGKPEFTYINYLKKNLKAGDSIAFNGELLSANAYFDFKNKFSNITVNNSTDLSQDVWKEKPEIFFSKMFILDEKYSGKSFSQKLSEIQDVMEKYKADVFLTAALDDIAWTLNLRASDIDFCPVFRSFLIIEKDTKTTLFIHKKRLSPEIEKYLSGLNIDTKEYDLVCDYLSAIKQKNIMLDGNTVNSLLYSSVAASCKIIDKPSPVQLLKAKKNPTELRNMNLSMIEDGLALERFFYRFEKNLAEGVKMTELSAAQILLEERKKSETFLFESFECISAFNPHAAMPHFAPSEKDNLTIEKDGVYLVDSGGQYLLGTTDVTRTIPTGKFPENFARDYTLVLIGNLNIAMQKFPIGTPGSRLDVLARQALWQYGLDFGHGTGHGVGYCLNCHEGPHAFSTSSKKNNAVAFEPGMIITDEPGLYIENQYGIRHENMLEVVKSSYDGFLEFKTMTLCHIDTRPIVKELLTKEHIKFLNAYNRMVYEVLSPKLEDKVREYLKERTAEI